MVPNCNMFRRYLAWAFKADRTIAQQLDFIGKGVLSSTNSMSLDGA